MQHQVRTEMSQKSPAAIGKSSPQVWHQNNRPEWLDAKGVKERYSVCKSTLYRLADEGKIRTCSLRAKGKVRGKRLFSTCSISAFIESMAKGGGAEL